jgi:predicted aldo/keto reductase-like oxidoreductase
MMQYRRLGRSNLSVSVVGFGTCQLRRVPEQQALDTLKRGFELGVNVVHTAPDYEGADDLVAQAVQESGRDVLILSQGYGDLPHFEWLFESACRKFGKQRLEMFGIACVDDREYLGEPVWGPGGMIEFLQRKKEQGRLGSIFCTTHGAPEYIARLVTSQCFDAIMLSYNSLGFHLLSYHPDASRAYEDIPRNRTEIFPLAARHDVGLMIMKPLAGGLLCESKSFPPHATFSTTPPKLTAAEVLRNILQHPEVACVVPGTSSVEEAEENARAGHEPLVISSSNGQAIGSLIDEIKATICSRCGVCDSLCSKRLPVSWLFRDAAWSCTRRQHGRRPGTTIRPAGSSGALTAAPIPCSSSERTDATCGTRKGASTSTT